MSAVSERGEKNAMIILATIINSGWGRRVEERVCRPAAAVIITMEMTYAPERRDIRRDLIRGSDSESYLRM